MIPQVTKRPPGSKHTPSQRCPSVPWGLLIAKKFYQWCIVAALDLYELAGRHGAGQGHVCSLHSSSEAISFRIIFITNTYFLLLSGSCLKFICKNSTGHQPSANSVGVPHPSVCLHFGRQKPFLQGLHRGLVTFESPSWSWDLCLGLNLDFAWQSLPPLAMWRGNVDLNLLFKLRVSLVSETASI